MNLLAQFKPVKLFVFDVDGVLTDGSLLIFDNGEQARTMNIKDGYALQLAVKKGYKVLVISGAQSTAVQIRLQKLGITDIEMGVQDKPAVLNRYLVAFGYSKEQVLFMGDDMPDLEAIQLAGFRCCPQDAVPEIRELCHYVSPFNGGMGCVRDVIEKVLKLNDDWGAGATGVVSQ